MDLRRIQTLKIYNLHIKNSLCEELLGINFDYKLDFAKHFEDICQKASKKLNTLARLAPYMMPSKKCILTNAFLKSLFNYCPLIWMCCTRPSNNKINQLYEWCLHIDKNTVIKNQILKNFLKEMVFSLFAIKISDF